MMKKIVALLIVLAVNAIGSNCYSEVPLFKQLDQSPYQQDNSRKLVDATFVLGKEDNDAGVVLFEVSDKPKHKQACSESKRLGVIFNGRGLSRKKLKIPANTKLAVLLYATIEESKTPFDGRVFESLVYCEVAVEFTTSINKKYVLEFRDLKYCGVSIISKNNGSPYERDNTAKQFDKTCLKPWMKGHISPTPTPEKRKYLLPNRIEKVAFFQHDIEMVDAEERRYIQETCESGVPTACVELGKIYLTGKGTKQDKNRAYELFQQACKAKKAGGCAGLGLFYYYGDIVERDLNQAKQYLNEACSRGEEFACKIPDNAFDE